ncbi:MAG: hypothetical protein K8I60_13220 [Anaerolineae bacterium]|nr:hypothetical protein [Anaerolineae bacterium]
MIYKVSYVVLGGEYPGGIKNQYDRPNVGDKVQIGRMMFEVTEIHEIMPPRDDFQFLHATIRPVEAQNGEKSSTSA